MKFPRIRLKALALVVFPLLSLSAYRGVLSLLVKNDQSHLGRQTHVTTKPYTTFNVTKSIGLGFGSQYYHPEFSIPHPPYVQVKRDIDQDVLKALCNGVLLYGKIQLAFNGFSSNALSFTKTHIKNGWTAQDMPNQEGLPERWHAPFGDISGHQTPDNKGARNILVFQDQPFFNKRGEYITETQIQAVYYATYFASPPAIFALNIKSPSNVLRKNFDDPPISDAEVERRVPPLNRFSDMIWTVWSQGIGKANPGRLRYIGHDEITNPISKLVMAYVLTHRRGVAFAAYPGELFDMTSQSGLALLGTPNGGGAGYVLLDRAQILTKRKTRFSVRIWTIRQQYYMLWDLGQHQDEETPLLVTGDGSILPLE
ncbi:MAG: hypothetical protein Q9218_006445 [Villophora microphyllina]